MARRLARLRPPYFGFALLLAWHLCRWFTPDLYPAIPLHDPRVMASRSGSIAGALLALLALSLATRRSVTPRGSAVWAVAIAATVTTVGDSALCGVHAPAGIVAIVGAVAGAAGATLWFLWGVSYVRLGASFSWPRMAIGFGVVTVAALALTWATRGWAPVAVVALLPTASGLLLVRALPAVTATTAPLPAPHMTAGPGRRVFLYACFSTFLVSFACAYIVQYATQENLPFGEYTYAASLALAGLAPLTVIVWVRRWPKRMATYRLVPWLMVSMVLAVSAIISRLEGLPGAASMLAIAVSAFFAFLFVSYMSALTRAGRLDPLVSFGLSYVLPWTAWLSGDVLAWLCLGQPGYTALEATAIGITAALLVSLVFVIRRENALHDLIFLSWPEREAESKRSAATVRLAWNDATVPPARHGAATAPTPDDAVQREAEPACTDAVELLAQDYGLSRREAEIVRSIRHGYTAGLIAERLFISTNTVNTHVKHIYEKVGIHSRTELLTRLDRYAGTTPPRS